MALGALPQKERRKYCAEEERERKIELKVVNGRDGKIREEKMVRKLFKMENFQEH